MRFSLVLLLALAMYSNKGDSIYLSGNKWYYVVYERSYS